MHADNKIFSQEGIKELANLGIRVSFSAPRDPRQNSLVERMHRFIKTQVRVWLDDESSYVHEAWPFLLSEIAFKLNVGESRSFNVSAFTAMFGRPPKDPFEERWNHDHENLSSEEAIRVVRKRLRTRESEVVKNRITSTFF